MKKHFIFYQRSYDDDFINGVKVKTSLESSYGSSSSESIESSNFKRQDAIIIEYNPKIFRIIREQDNITTEELL